jgi:phosphonate transport system permease protein
MTIQTAPILSQSDRAALRLRHAAILRVAWPARARMLAGLAIFTALYVYGLISFGLTPALLITGLWRMWDIAGLMLPPNPGSAARALIYLGALGQTLAIAFFGTLLGAALALPMGFLAARNIVANRILHVLSRRSLDVVRSIDTLIWALIWIDVVGLGPFAGALAIASSDFAALGKLFSETIETADRRPGEGILAAGGSRLHAIRFGIVPQILPVFASQLLFFFESNTRSATIIGIVGAGGIGLYLSEQIRVLEWKQVSFLIVMILIAVALIDRVSRSLRGVIMGGRVERRK